MGKVRSVALLIETSNEYARGLLRGIMDYQHEHGQWAIDLPEQHRGAAPPMWLRRYKGDGIIARVETDAIARAVHATKLPVIDVSAARYLPSTPWVETDDAAIADLAIKHFAERGLKHVAFCGEAAFNWSAWRQDPFVELANAASMTCDVFDVAGEGSGRTWSQERRRPMSWIKRLPQPCGVMAAYDSLARRVLETCKLAGRSIPDSIAVLGVDDDPLLCQLTTPALSSVIPDAEGAGYVAAELLDRMMAGEPVEPEGTLLPPRGIATRRSTDTVAVEDPNVAAAVRFILTHAADGIRVADVVASVPITRRALELRFKAMLGMTPHELIVSTRIANAERLLRDTSLSLEKIAYQCGIENPEYLNVLFRKHRGITPGEYRRTQRSR